MSTPTLNFEHIAAAFETHREDLKRYLLARTRDVCDAEDIVQDTFLHLLESETVVLPSTLRQLIYRVATNIFIDRTRRRQKLNNIYSTIYYVAPRGGEATTEHVVLAHEVEAIESNVISMMPPRRRTIYQRIQHHGDSPACVAADMGISEKTVNCHLFFGRREVRRVLKASGF